MTANVAFIGFGEAAQTFVGAPGWSAHAKAYDKLVHDPESRATLLADCSALAVSGTATSQEALGEADLVLSLVTAGEALAAATNARRFIRKGALYCDMNSVSPETKRSAAALIDAGGGSYVDVSIMSPVKPAELDAPLLVSGPRALEAERALRGIGFRRPRSIGGRVGDASSIKMIRSVLVKGIEALTAEAMLAAFEADVVDEVLNSLDSSERSVSWRQRADYNLGRMIAHGLRRAEEMEEVVRTLQSLGIEPTLTRGTVWRQREIGVLGLDPKAGLEAKLEQFRDWKADAA